MIVITIIIYSMHVCSSFTDMKSDKFSRFFSLVSIVITYADL